MSDELRLRERFASMADNGLLDVKFDIRYSPVVTVGAIYSEVNALYDAINIRPLNFKDSRREQKRLKPI